MSRQDKSRPAYTVRTGDCLKLLATLPASSVDLAFADPPYGIGYDAYDKYDDKQPEASYLCWMNQWLAAIYRVLKPAGAFWLAIGDEYAAHARMLATQHALVRGSLQQTFPGFHLRSWCLWYFTFGISCQRNFARSHTHLLYFTKSKTKFVFNQTDPDLRVPSARQLVYNDKRANPKGKLPDNTWVLSPLDLSKAFSPQEDTWLESRVCGTFKEREERGTNKEKLAIPQMPEAVVDRIIAACGVPGGLCIDPFGGTFTTGVCAVRQGMNFWGCDISKNYVARGRRRIKEALG